MTMTISCHDFSFRTGARDSALCATVGFLSMSFSCSGLTVGIPFTNDCSRLWKDASFLGHRVRRVCDSPFSSTSLKMISIVPSEEEIEKQLARARDLIARSEQMNKKNKKEKANMSTDDKRAKVTKFTKDDGSGLSTYDGDLMAELSQKEDWEMRSLMDVFQDDMEATIDALNTEEKEAIDSLTGIESSEFGEEEKLKKKFFFASTPTTKKLANRDEGKAVTQMRVKMNPADFDRIFDKKNRFIGEV